MNENGNEVQKKSAPRYRCSVGGKFGCSMGANPRNEMLVPQKKEHKKFARQKLSKEPSLLSWER